MISMQDSFLQPLQRHISLLLPSSRAVASAGAGAGATSGAAPAPAPSGTTGPRPATGAGYAMDLEAMRAVAGGLPAHKPYKDPVAAGMHPAHAAAMEARARAQMGYYPTALNSRGRMGSEAVSGRLRQQQKRSRSSSSAAGRRLPWE